MKFVWIALAIGAIVLIARKRNEGGDNKKTEKKRQPPVLPPKKEKVWEPAEFAVEKNLTKIAPLLRGVSRESITNSEEWTSLVISINNDDLTQLWKECVKRPELWVTYLQTFKLQMEWVDSFEGLDGYKEKYSMENGDDIVIGKKYRVVSPCWIYTDKNNQKSVILKGIVKPQ